MSPKKTHDHTIDYIILLVSLLTAVISVKLFHLSDKSLSMVISFISIIYVVWGVFHHKKAGHIDQKIMLEYTSIAVLVNILVWLITS